MTQTLINYPSDTNRIGFLAMPASQLNSSLAALNAAIKNLTDAITAAQAQLALLVPYTGATGDVDLGTNALTAGEGSFTDGSSNSVTLCDGTNALQTQGNAYLGTPPSIFDVINPPPILVTQDTFDGVVNGMAIISNSASGEGAFAFKTDLHIQYPDAEAIGEIQGVTSDLDGINNIILQGEGGLLYVGAMANDGSGATLQTTIAANSAAANFTDQSSNSVLLCNGTNGDVQSGSAINAAGSDSNTGHTYSANVIVHAFNSAPIYPFPGGSGVAVGAAALTANSDSGFSCTLCDDANNAAVFGQNGSLFGGIAWEGAAGTFWDGANVAALCNGTNAIAAVGSTSLDNGAITTDGSGKITAVGQIAYAPATPAHWSTLPTSIQQALDMIAAHLNPV